MFEPEANVRSWLSSTLGYVSGNDVWFGNLPVSRHPWIQYKVPSFFKDDHLLAS